MLMEWKRARYDQIAELATLLLAEQTNSRTCAQQIYYTV